MATPNALKRLEERYGDLKEIIPATVNRLGSIKAAADELGISASTVHNWGKVNGYRIVYRWVKVEGFGNE